MDTERGEVMSESTVSSAKSGAKPGVASSSGNWRWNLLLLLPYIGLLWMPFYAKADPRLWGFPFFYWYQFLWVFLTMVLIEFVRRRTR